jgi:hypothetical protein
MINNKCQLSKFKIVIWKYHVVTEKFKIQKQLRLLLIWKVNFDVNKSKW